MKKKKRNKVSKEEILKVLREHGLTVEQIRNPAGFRIWVTSDGTKANSLADLKYFYRGWFNEQNN